MSPRTPQQFDEIRQRTRKAILDAALVEFSGSGYHAASTAKIARRAGISKGSIYSYFGSKEDLLRAVFDDIVQLGDEVIPEVKGLDPKEYLRMVLEGTFEFLEKRTELAIMLAQLALQKDVVQTMEERVRKVVEEKITSMIPVFEALGYQDPRSEAWWLGAILDGITMGYISRGDSYPLLEMKQKLLKTYDL